jgi:choline dehydrogenase
MSRNIFATAPLSSYVTGEIAPGLTNVPANAPLQTFKDWTAANYHTGYHPLGSVPLMPKEDGGAVSPELLVYGTKNVRVIGSWIPFIASSR